MKNLTTVLLLAKKGSFVMIGDKKLKVEGYMSSRKVYTTSALVAARKKGKDAFRNERQRDPTPKVVDKEMEEKQKRERTKIYAKKAEKFIMK